MYTPKSSRYVDDLEHFSSEKSPRAYIGASSMVCPIHMMLVASDAIRMEIPDGAG
jgi:hypothetical protein